MHDEDGTTQIYVSNGYGDSFLTSIKDASGVGWTITRSNGSVATTVTVTHTDGQSFTAVYQDNIVNGKFTGSTVTLTDPAGNVYTYVTNPYGNITRETLPGSPQTIVTYTYADPGVELTEVDYNASPYSYTTYNSGRQATGTHLADGSDTTSIVYSYPAGGEMAATITNPLGHTTVQQYVSANSPSGNAYYRLVSVSDNAVQDCGATIHTRAYDSNGNLAKTVDNDGITHTYSYAANGQLQTETEASGTDVARTINYTWDSNLHLNRVLSATVPGESKTSYTYNAQNRIASITRTNLTGIGTANQSLTTTYAYTLYGNGVVETMTVTQPSPSGSDHTTYVYDSHGNVSSVTDGLGHVTAYSGYNGLGEVGKVVGPNGDETDYTYDARGRVANKTTHPNGTAATWTYAYDGFGLLAKVSAPDGEVTTWARDAEKRVKTITHNDKDGTSTETFAYDANNDITSNVVARGSDVGKSTSYVYDALGRVYQVKGSHSQVLTYAYDGDGNVLSVTDALGHKTSFAYDALDRLAGIANAAGGITSYVHDAGDHVTQVTDPRDLVAGYAWDGLDQLWQQNSPDSGITNFSYDTYGRLASKTRADGTQVSYAYDALNRLTSKTASGVTRIYTWDACTNGKARLCVASNQGYDNVGYSYSPEGWITGRAFTFSNGTSYGLGYAYDNMGHLTEVAYPDGNTATYDYTDGAVADVRLKVGTYNIYGVTGIAYRPMDSAMSTWTSYNGLSNAIVYDTDLRPTSISVPTVESLTFTYDTADRINHITNGLHSNLTQGLSYDGLNRLTTVTSGADNESYSYDANGNRIYQVINGVATTYSIAATSNRLNSASGGYNDSYGYDAEGDMTTLNGSPWWQYGPFDRLASVGGMSYENSAEGQRILKSGPAGSTYFAPGASGTPLAEYQSQEGVWLDYVWLNGRLVTVVTSNGGVYPVHDDQTGRPIAMTNLGNQSVIWAAQDLPFTTNVTTTTWFSLNARFPGQYYDSEDEVSYNGNRDYSEVLGRYIESDPIGLAGGVNTYTYVGNNPITSIDPLGLCDKKIHCDTPLPDGSTVGDHVRALASVINSGIVPILGEISAVYSGTDFRKIYGGSGANYRFLGDAGNFAYGAVTSDIGIPLSATEMVAGAYSMTTHSRSDWVGPYNMDPSATKNVPAGYSAKCLNP